MVSLAHLLAFAFPLPAPQFFEKTVQPTKCSSITGRHVLEVEPSKPSGDGPMHLQLLRGKEVVWSGEFPWTFEEVGLAEDGTAVGYANYEFGDESLRIAVLDPAGKLRKQHEIKTEARVMHGPALPCASYRVLIHDVADQAWIRVHPADQSRPAPWRSFRLSTGEFIGEIVPQCPVRLADRQSVYERDARAIGDTGLTLSHWWTADYAPSDLAWPKAGGLFALLDLTGKPVWHLPLLEDYTDRTSEEADLRLYHRVEEGDPILSAGPGNRFALWHVREDQSVDYTVEKDAAAPEGWRVREIGRRSMASAAVPTKAAKLVHLKLKDRVVLDPTANLSAIRDVAAIGFTDTGDLEIMREGSADGLSYVRLDKTGTVVLEKELISEPESGNAWRSLFDLPGDRWLVRAHHSNPEWFEIDVKTGLTKPVPLPGGGGDSAIAPMPDGSYLAVVPQHMRGVAFTGMYYVRADGSIGWREEEFGAGPDDTDFQRAVYFARDIVCSGERSFTVLGIGQLSVIDLEKRVLRTTELTALLGHDPGYLCDLLPDRSGGVYFDEGGRFWHVDSNGSSIGSFGPERADGTMDSAFGGLLSVAPDGRLWTSDGARLYRLDDAGVEDLVLGAPLRDDELTEPEISMVDGLGRILIRDRISQSVHVFDSGGKKLFVCKVTPEERTSEFQFESVLARTDGSIWVVVWDGLLQFDSRGERVESFDKAGKKSPYRVAKELADLDAVKQATKSIQRRPDGKWLTGVSARGVLADGRRVLLERPEEGNSRPALHLYSRSNGPMGSIDLPEGTYCDNLSTSARWIVVGDYGPSWTLVRVEDQKILRFESGLEDPGNWHAGQTPDGRTLLLLNARRRELVRYDLP